MDTPTIKLRARQDGWTPDRQRAFLAALRETGSVAQAAARVGMSRVSAYRLRRRPEAAAFAAAWDAALARVVPPRAPSAVERALAGEGDVFELGGAALSFRWPCSARELIRLLDRAAAAQAKVTRAGQKRVKG